MDFILRKINKKLFLKLLFFCVFLACVLVGGTFGYLKYSTPQLDGEISLSFLENSVDVFRDSYGVVHLETSARKDALKSLGFIAASERLFQMEIARRLSQGSLSEVVGVKALESDKLFRVLGLRYYSEKLIQKKIREQSFSPQFLTDTEAFFEGVNEFINTSPMPIEFKILGIKPRPFSLVDSYAFVGLMAFSFGVATMQEPLLEKLKKDLEADLLEDLRGEKESSDKILSAISAGQILSTQSVNDYLVSRALDFLQNGFPLFEGSNGWLIAKERSTSGFPLFANDPHISYSHPGIWFEAKIKTQDDLWYGHYLSLLPFPVLRHDRFKAWGFTMSLTDDMDLYRESVDYKNRTYQFKNTSMPLESRQEIIQIKGKPELTLEVLSTHHGPLLDEIGHKSVSLQWAFHRPYNDPLSVLFKMSEAQKMEDFKAALADGVAPGLNVLYADQKNIAWWMFGEIWKKRKGLKTDFFLDGTTGEDEIQKVMPFKEKPFMENPASGIIVSANTRPEGFPKELRGDWQLDDRYLTIETVLNQKEKWSLEELKEVQTLSTNFENKELLELLLVEVSTSEILLNSPYKELKEILEKWNFVSDADQVAPTVFYTWVTEIQEQLLSEISIEDRDILNKIPNASIFLKRVILDLDSPWWKKFPRQKLIEESLIAAVTSLSRQLGTDIQTWNWGRVHTLEFIHPLGRVFPLNYIFNVGPVAISGASHEVNNQKSTGVKDGFKVKAGPSVRRLIDFSDVNASFGVLPLGNSGHLLSPFYKDQLPLFLEGRYRFQWLNLPPDQRKHHLILKAKR